MPLAVKPHSLMLPSLPLQVVGLVLFPFVFVMFGQVRQAASFTAPFWLLPIDWPVPAEVGTPNVAVALETEADKAPVALVLAEVKLAPPSMASEHPSPSESKSKRFGIPSLSVSMSVVQTDSLK